MSIVKMIHGMGKMEKQPGARDTDDAAPFAPVFPFRMGQDPGSPLGLPQEERAKRGSASSLIIWATVAASLVPLQSRSILGL